MRSRAIREAAALIAVLASSTQAGAAPDAAAADRGSVVVAVGATTWAARSLARDVYREPDLLAPIDDAAARVLVGETVPDSEERLASLTLLRAALVDKDGQTHDARDAAGRRMLAGLGAEARARIVVAVELEGDVPVARIVRVSDAQLVGDAVFADTSDPAAGVRWPGALVAIRAALPSTASAAPAAKAPAVASSRAPTPRKEAAARPSSIWQSPWLWVGLGAVAASCAAIFAVGSAVQDDASVVHGQGRVAP